MTNDSANRGGKLTKASMRTKKIVAAILMVIKFLIGTSKIVQAINKKTNPLNMTTNE